MDDVYNVKIYRINQRFEMMAGLGKGLGLVPDC